MSVAKVFTACLFLALFALPAAAAESEEALFEPISQTAYSDDLEQAGYRNGDMPSFRMIEVENCLLERDAAYTLSLMLEAARQDGIYLSTEDCYRSYGSQSSAYEKRCPVEEEEVVKIDPVTGEETVVGVTRTRSCTGPPIARPGRSNHGWGRAVDFSTGRRVLTCYDSTFTWLQENAGRFGWVHPDWAACGRATQEPWHWEWGGVQEALPVPSTQYQVFTAAGTRIR